MPSSLTFIRSRRSAAALGALAGLAVAAAAAVPAGASAAAGAARHPSDGHHASPFPVVVHARTRAKEPIVRADKAKPPTKVLVKNLIKGSGAAATAASTVTVKYVGVNYRTGKAFTKTTWTTGSSTSFALRGVVPGFSTGLVGMKVGGRREIVIPPKYGYKTRSAGPIKANETLVFVVDLEKVHG